jgi:outer membrane protein assembly factor BamB
MLYGIDGRQDVGRARLRAFDPASGKIHWTEADFGTGSLILVGDRLLIMRTDGSLVVAEATPRKYQPLAEAKLFDTTTQALPALADGRLFVRDTRTLKCFAVGRPAVPPQK